MFSQLHLHSRWTALFCAVGPVLALVRTFGKDMRGEWARLRRASYLVRTTPVHLRARSP